jgi:hypothetical protein
MSSHIAQLPRQLTAPPGELGGYFLLRVVVKPALSGQLNKTVKLLIVKSMRALIVRVGATDQIGTGQFGRGVAGRSVSLPLQS